jgi:hypothetical protein
MDAKNAFPPAPERAIWLDKMIKMKRENPPLVMRTVTEVFIGKAGDRYELPPRRVKMRADQPTTIEIPLDWNAPTAPRAGTSRYWWLRFLIAKKKSEKRIARGEAYPWDYWPDSRPPPNLPIFVPEDLREPTRRVEVKVEPGVAPPPAVTDVDPGPPLTKEEARELRRKTFLEIAMDGMKRESDEENERPSKLWAQIQERRKIKREEQRQAAKIEAQLHGVQSVEVPDESDFVGDSGEEGPLP